MEKRVLGGNVITKPVDTVPVSEEIQETPVEKPAEGAETPSEQEIDYKAELERTQKQLEKANFTLYKKDKEERRQKREAQPAEQPVERKEEPIVDTEREQVRREAEEAARSFLEAEKRQEAAEFLEDELQRLTEDPDERSLIRLIYDNRLTKTGYSPLAIRSDLEEARFLANRPKFLKEKSELAKAAASKKAVSTVPQGTSVQRPEAPDDLRKLFSATDWDWMKNQMKWSDEKIRSVAQNRKK